MNNLFAALRTNDASTQNGAVTHSTSGNYALDFFFASGASRGADISDLFVSALRSDPTTAMLILQQMRDIRGGAGERDQFIKLMKVLTGFNSEWANKILMNTPEVGRWKDVVVLASEEPKLLDTALIMFATALRDQNGLAAKWSPRKGYFASKLAKFLGLSHKEYRKLVVGLSNTVEQKMCARRWDEIDFSKLPSIASSMYQKAFWKQAETRYKEYVESLKKGTAKVNAAAIFPYQIIRSALNTGFWDFADAQWNALPDYINGSKRNLLCVVDVSPSMDVKVNSKGDHHKKVDTTCMDVAISLGLYVSERMEGIFKNLFITFSSEPAFVDLTGCRNLADRVQTAKSSDWGGSTDLYRTFEVVLERAQKAGLSQEDMPSDIIIFSDMEFDDADHSTNDTTFQRIDKLYADAGYTRPNLIFWNIRRYDKNNPVKVSDAGTALVSGLSPAIMKSILSGDSSAVDPVSMMMEALSDPRYITVL